MTRHFASDARAEKQGLPFARVEDMRAGTRFLCPHGDVWVYQRPHEGNRWAHRATRELDGVQGCFAATATRPVLGEALRG